MHSENQTIPSALLDERGSGHSESRSTAIYREGTLFPLVTYEDGSVYRSPSLSPCCHPGNGRRPRSSTISTSGTERNPRRRETAETMGCANTKIHLRPAVRTRRPTCDHPSGIQSSCSTSSRRTPQSWHATATTSMDRQQDSTVSCFGTTV